MYLSIWVTAPIMAYGNMYRLLAFVSMLSWLAIEIVDKKGVIQRPTQYILLLYLFLLYTTPVSILADGTSILLRNIQLYVYFFFIIIYASYERKSLKILTPVINLNIVLMAIWTVTTYNGLLGDNHIARTLVRSSEVAIEATKNGIGGFSFIYSLLIYIIMLLALIKYKYKEKKISLYLVLLIFTVILAISVVLKAEYSTAVILMFSSISYFIFYSKSISKNIITFLIFIIILIIIREYKMDILKFLQPFAEGTNYRLKLQDLIHSLNIGEATGTAADRIERYIRSFTLFLDNPIVGIWSINSVGKHSFILDTFAQFGLFAGVLLIYVLFKIPYQIIIRHKKNKILGVTMLMLIVSLSSLNNLSMAYGFMFYIFYPNIIERIENA